MPSPITPAVVHIHRGRLNHLDDCTGRMRTYCDRPWDATVTGPPTSDREPCPTCAEYAATR